MLPRAVTGDHAVAMVELYRGTYLVVTRDDTAKLIRVRRTSAPINSTTDMYGLHAQLLRTLPVRERAGLSVLLDVREAPMPATEEVAVEAVKVFDSMASDFDRAALVVRSAVGALQVRRITRTNPVRFELFEDEPTALAYLGGLGPMPGSTGRRSSLPPPSGGRSR